jgi:hypothetical protein
MLTTHRDEDVAQRLNEIYCSDPERAQEAADAILCGLLTLLGYAKTVEAYKLVPKW